MSHSVELRLPDLGASQESIRLSLWLVDAGQSVSKGDRLVEILMDCATVDLPSPVSGMLKETLVGEDEIILPGQVLAILEEEAQPLDGDI